MASRVQKPASTAVPAALNASSGPNREIFGYALASSLGDPNFGYPSWNFNLLSTVAFFAIRVQYDGVLVADSDWAVWDSPTLTGLVNTAHAHGVKVVVTIVGPHALIDQCDALYNDNTTILQLVNQVKLKNVDGVNIDYEGQLGQCNPTNPAFQPASNQTLLTKLAKDLRQALDAVRPGYYLSIATYSGSASGPDGYFNIPDLNKWVDSFFVMAYDMDAANQGSAPLICARFCMAPVSPLGGSYYWNESTSMSQYISVVGASKVVLGLPYYGRVACVASLGPNSNATGPVDAATYLDAAAAVYSPDVQPGSYSGHRGDPYDPNGQDRWDIWYDTVHGCWREMYWSDATELGARYDFANQKKLRGVGFWTLNYGGGASELWNQIAASFTACKGVSTGASPVQAAGVGSTVTISAAASPCRAPTYEFFIMAPGASSYQVAQAYSTSPTFAWNTAGLTPGTWRIGVWAQDANSPGQYSNVYGTFDASTSFTYTVTTCVSASTTVAPGSTAGIGASVTITAHSTGCPSANPNYQFWLLAPGANAYQLARAYSNSAAYTWNTTGFKPGTYRIGIWVRDANSAGAYTIGSGTLDASDSSVVYSLNTCTGAGLTVSGPSRGIDGRLVTLSATSAGCPNANPQYQFFVLDPGASAYRIVQPFSPSPTFIWNTRFLGPGTYRVAVWVRDAASGGLYSNVQGTWDAAAFGTATLSWSPPPWS